jgi:hypothetical protein
MKLIGNTENKIDWDSIIESCKTDSKHVLRFNEECFPKTEAFENMGRLWKERGYVYNDPTIEWFNYFPGEHFSQSVVDTFESIVDTKPWMVWISKIKPGRMAPWHIDIHSKIDLLLEKGVPVRYTCYIEDYSMGHVSIVGDTCVYQAPKGSIYQWDLYDEWHCGMNGGFTDKYMFNYWGYKD